MALATKGDDLDSVETSLDELSRLAETAGAEEVGRFVQVRDAPDPATFIGKGKAAEIAECANALGAGLVVFDDELRPSQQSNLADLIDDAKVLDRTGLILDIFAQHAHTAEGKLQVELAQQKYRLTRLTGRGNELSRLGGGIGTRGPGEQKLEVDRRRIRSRIAHLERDLKGVERTRRVKRKGRVASSLPKVALVGYTNAGKSTLMNRLTSAGVIVEDQLFSTLDPTTAQLLLPGGRRALVSDTVGFVNKLPHQLIEAFRSTLDEVRDADLLIILIDASSSDPAEQLRSVREVLAELDSAEIPQLVVANKIDLAPDFILDRLAAHESALKVISARTGEGIDDLLGEVARRVRPGMLKLNLLIPYEAAAEIARIRDVGEVTDEEHTAEGIRIEAAIPEETQRLWRRFEAATGEDA